MSQAIDKHVRAATKPNGRPPKPKHIDPLLASTFSRDRVLNDIVHALADRLKERDGQVIFKALIVLHTLIRNGGVALVLGAVASGDAATELKTLSGRGGYGSNVRGYTAIVRNYATYLDDRVRAFKELKHDVIRASDSDRAGSGTSNRLRSLTVDRGLLREIGITQKVGNAVLNADFFSEDLRDPLVVVAAQMCFKDVLAVYAGINEGVINMLEHYFEMAKTDASRALELYRRFVSQTEKVVAYLGKSRSVSSSLGFQVPKLRHAPTGLATALQEYLDDPNFEQNRLEYKESKRIADGGAPSKPSTTTTSSAPSKPADSGTSAPPKDEPPAPKPPTDNQAVQDFFASIDTNPTQSTFAVPQDAFTDMYGGMYAMPPGGSYDPNFGVNPMMTGMQPQATGYNPFAAPTTGFVGAQPTGFQQPQPTGFPQQQPFDQAFNQPQQPSQITAQQTGTFNPFRPGAVGTQAPVGAQQTGFNNGVVPQVTGFAYGNTQYPQPTGVPPQQTGLPPQQTGIQQQQTGAAPGPNPAHLPPVRDTKSPPPARSAGSAKPLVAQKTGSRNPFAPPGGVPSPPPSRPTLPTLSELAEQGVSNKYGLGADGWDGSSGSTPKPSSNSPFGQSGPSSSAGLQPQATGLLGNVASEFTQSGQANLGAQATGFGASQAPQSQAPQPSSTGVGQQDLSGQLGNLSLNNNNQLGSQSTGLAPQPTGNVQPFKPSSAFGASLTGQPTGQQPTSHFGSINPQMTSTTGNPFGASQSAAPSSGLGSSLSSQPTGFGLGSQPTGLGTGLSSQATGAPGLSLNTQPTGLNSGLGSGPGSGLGSAGPTSSPLNAQPTGVSGSSVKPFQPSSAFGQSQFGQPGAQPTGQSTQQRSTTFGTLI